MFKALGLTPKEIRRRLNKNDGLIREKLKVAGAEALIQAILYDNMEPRDTLTTYRDVLLLDAEDELEGLVDERKTKHGWRIVRKQKA